jgi:hypothetical protein
MKYYQPIKHKTYSRFKTDRIDESKLIQVIKHTDKQVIPHLEIITANLHHLKGKPFDYCSKCVSSIIEFLDKNKFITDKQLQLVLTIKRQVVSAISK